MANTTDLATCTHEHTIELLDCAVCTRCEAVLPLRTEPDVEILPACPVHLRRAGE